MKSSKPLLLSVLSENNSAAVKDQLSLYKDMGMVSYRKVLELSLDERIPALIKKPGVRNEILMALVAALKSAFSNLNLRLGMNEDQIVELADMIIDQSHEDNLGLEDVLLFLGELLTGKSGKIYDRMDIPTFFELFETYRQKRHETMKSHREEQEAQYKALPINDRFVHDSVESEKNISREAMKSYLRSKPTETTNDENQ
jgi:hypothetical protein